MQTTIAFFLLAAAVTAFLYCIHLERRAMRRYIRALESGLTLLETRAALLQGLLTLTQRERDEANADLERLRCGGMSSEEARRWLSSHVARRPVSEN